MSTKGIVNWFFLKLRINLFIVFHKLFEKNIIVSSFCITGIKICYKTMQTFSAFSFYFCLCVIFTIAYLRFPHFSLNYNIWCYLWRCFFTTLVFGRKTLSPFKSHVNIRIIHTLICVLQARYYFPSGKKSKN